MAILLVLLFAFGMPAASAQYNPTEPGFIIDPPTVGVGGGTVTVSGKGCPAASTVNIYVEDTLVGTTTAKDDRDGTFTTTVQIPAGLTPGTHTVFVRCGNVVLSNTLTVTVTVTAVAVQAPNTLPKTGSNSAGFVRVALVLVALGGLLVLSTRRRRQRV